MSLGNLLKRSAFLHKRTQMTPTKKLLLYLSGCFPTCLNQYGRVDFPNRGKSTFQTNWVGFSMTYPLITLASLQLPNRWVGLPMIARHEQIAFSTCLSSFLFRAFRCWLIPRWSSTTYLASYYLCLNFRFLICFRSVASLLVFLWYPSTTFGLAATTNSIKFQMSTLL